MSDLNRRKLLAVTGMGAVAGSVALVAGPASAAVRRSGSAQEPVVAFVEDHDSDELRLMVGERELVVHDRDLVTRLLNAAGGF
ncbi:MAG: hypothetical protein ABIN79_12390 [Marmoricola sp.]